MKVQPAAFLRTTLPLDFSQLAVLDSGRYHSIWLPDHMVSFWPDSIWTPEFTDLATVSPSPHRHLDGLAVASAAAVLTENVPIATSVVDTVRRHPSLLAQTALTIDHLSHGRFILGVGSGEMENTEPYGFDFSRLVGRFEESLQVIRLLWESEDDLHPFCTPTRKLGGDAADISYLQAWIDGQCEYRLFGNRGSARFLNFTLQGQRPDKQPGTEWPSLHEPFGDIPEVNLFGHELSCDPDGNFELFLGGVERAPNWLPTTAGTRKLFIRQGFDDWAEQPAQLSIERIGMTEPRPLPGCRPPVLAAGGGRGTDPGIRFPRRLLDAFKHRRFL
jgi:hypothetical protein